MFHPHLLANFWRLHPPVNKGGGSPYEYYVNVSCVTSFPDDKLENGCKVYNLSSQVFQVTNLRRKDVHLAAVATNSLAEGSVFEG